MHVGRIPPVARARARTGNGREDALLVACSERVSGHARRAFARMEQEFGIVLSVEPCPQRAKAPGGAGKSHGAAASRGSSAFSPQGAGLNERLTLLRDR